jgi:hypothetical protein
MPIEAAFGDRACARSSARPVGGRRWATPHRWPPVRAGARRAALMMLAAIGVVALVGASIVDAATLGAWAPTTTVAADVAVAVGPDVAGDPGVPADQVRERVRVDARAESASGPGRVDDAPALQGLPPLVPLVARPTRARHLTGRARRVLTGFVLLCAAAAIAARRRPGRTLGRRAFAGVAGDAGRAPVAARLAGRAPPLLPVV